MKFRLKLFSLFLLFFALWWGGEKKGKRQKRKITSRARVPRRFFIFFFAYLQKQDKFHSSINVSRDLKQEEKWHWKPMKAKLSALKGALWIDVIYVMLIWFDAGIEERMGTGKVRDKFNVKILGCEIHWSHLHRCGCRLKSSSRRSKRCAHCGASRCRSRCCCCSCGRSGRRRRR